MIDLQLANGRLDIDNMNLKRMLRLAMDELVGMRSCANCAHEADSPNCKECRFEWVHADEAEKLLGGGEE